MKPRIAELTFLALALVTGTLVSGAEVVSRIAFAGGNSDYADQTFWERVVLPALTGDASDTSPVDMFMWLGGATQTIISPDKTAYPFPKPIEFFREKLECVRESATYKAFLERAKVRRVRGTLDSDDLGQSTSGLQNGLAKHIRSEYLGFLLGAPSGGRPIDIEADKSLTNQVQHHSGFYYFEALPLETSSRLSQYFVNSMCFVVLDVYSSRGPHPNFADNILKPYAENFGHKVDRSSDDILGTAQWDWLEETVRKYVAGTDNNSSGKQQCLVTFIVSPLSVLLNDYKPLDGWDLYPRSRSRLLNILRHYRAQRFVFLTSHNGGFGEIGKVWSVKNTRDESKIVNKFGRLYEDTRKIDPVTYAAAALLPGRPPIYSAEDPDDVNALREVSSWGLTQSAREIPLFGRLHATLLGTSRREDCTAAELHSFPRYVCVRRNSAAGRNFGELRLLDDETRVVNSAETAIRHTRLEVNIYSATNKKVLLRESIPLSALPRYTESPTSSRVQVSLSSYPQFYLHNSPSEFPFLKKWTLEHQQPELSIFAGSIPVLLQVTRSVLITIVVLTIFVVIVFIVIAMRNHQEKKKKFKID